MARTPKTPATTEVASATTNATPAKRAAVFGPDQCHQRDDAGQPSCNETRQKGRNLCKAHEAVWQAAAKLRRAERIASGTVAPNAPKSAGTSAKATPKPNAPVVATGTKAQRKNAVTGKGSTPAHPATVLRAPVQRVANATAEFVAPQKRARSAAAPKATVQRAGK